VLVLVFVFVDVLEVVGAVPVLADLDELLLLLPPPLVTRMTTTTTTTASPASRSAPPRLETGAPGVREGPGVRAEYAGEAYDVESDGDAGAEADEETGSP